MSLQAQFRVGHHAQAPMWSLRRVRYARRSTRGWHLNGIRRAAWTLLVLLGLLVAALVVYARLTLPTLAGEISLPGLSAPLRIERDAQGIPTIKAANGRDLAFGLGVVHAQDRLWQLETHRRIGSGRLAEAFGDGALDNDRFLRALGVRRLSLIHI